MNVSAPEADTTPPVITLQGANPLSLLVGESYVEPGYTATDDVDGDLTSQVVVTGIVNTAVEGTYPLTYTVSDAAGNTGTALRTVNVSAPGTAEVLFRVNVGGPQLAAADSSLPVWAQDTGGNPSPYRTAGGGSTYSTAKKLAYKTVTADASVPSGAPTSLFATERWDPPSGAEMLWQFPVSAGAQVEVRLYFAEIYSLISTSGQRAFDVAVEGTVPAVFDGIDPYAVGGAGGGFMLSHTLTTPDALLDLEFRHVIENPALKAIEILQWTE